MTQKKINFWKKLASVGFNILLMTCLFCSFSTADDLIDRFDWAIYHDNPEEIREVWEEINKSPALVDYMRVNEPSLFVKYTRLRHQYENEPEDETFKIGEWTNQDTVRNFPIQDRQSNQEIVRDEPNENIKDQRYYRDFSNANRFDNKELVRQRLRQARRRGVNAVETNFKDGKIVLSVSGIDQKEVDALQEVLKDHMRSIDSMEEVYYKRGVVEYLIEIDINSEDFSNRLQQQDFGLFHLELIYFHPEKIEVVFVLN